MPLYNWGSLRICCENHPLFSALRRLQLLAKKALKKIFIVRFFSRTYPRAWLNIAQINPPVGEVSPKADREFFPAKAQKAPRNKKGLITDCADSAYGG